MDGNPVILSLETATLGGSVFVGRGIRQLATRSGDPEVSHSNSLLSDINDCLEEAGLKLSDVDVLACATGPGSFTGLRIGIATMKGLSATLNLPCAGIPTLQAVALAAGPSQSTIALLPAGRGEVFAQMFSVSEAGIVAELDPAAHLSPQRMVEKYRKFSELTWAGSGAHLQREFLKSFAQEQGIGFEDERVTGSLKHEWVLAPRSANLAMHVASLALQRFQRGELQSAQQIHALYVRPSDAELKEQCR